MKERSLLHDSLNEIFLGSVSGACGKLVEYPFDTIKVRLQYSQSLDNQLYNSTFHAIKQTFLNEGIVNGFYKGLKIPLMGAALEASCLFFSYNIAQDFIKLYKGIPLGEELGNAGKLVSGAFSGIATSFVLTPIELVKCKFQVDNLKSNSSICDNINDKTSLTKSTTANSKSVSQITFNLIKKEGIIGLFKGHTATMLRECGGSMAWFGNYEFTLQYFAGGNKDYKPKVWELMVAGANAGIGYNCILFPVDTVKSILQTNESKELTAMRVIRHVYRTAGIAGFYSGVGITLLKTIPTSSLMFLVYEKLKEVI
ncbi:hypothetical protein CAS74_001177 [Pichia kudriavzevii]|uniref:Mitochondrial ornithine transporter 1 n=1 Tax=Pichia kudriavzevii TaxID=4909 RepID=A0A099P163_PICKU|nr:uncharacterized protein C5L36_0C11580 [Pichia kudriavzevii]AWU77252.1 hypothetical protein C5L36_0C11580 [Pichia kudriavzevii]KGK38650.1 hypothetical protein JL09_g2166 [Pichia kudriavzevii]OUT24786.1 hypothetical protein CAS74_001177 [Pichia kudriavzevii]